MRRDGRVIPYAAFDGKRWTAVWSGPQVVLAIPINVESVPKSWWGPVRPQTEWQWWPAVGVSPVSPRTVSVTQTDWVQAHCVRQIALRTDYRADRPEPPVTEQPYPKDGLAIAPPHPVEPIAMLSLESAESQALRSAVTAAFDRAERDIAHHPIKREARERVAVDLQAVYAFGAAPRYYYVESARGYKSDSGRNTDCSMAFGTGWFIKDGEQAVKKVDMAVDLLPCNTYGATYMLPFGVVRANSRMFWLAQYSGWDHERYMVIELKSNTVQALVGMWGGGC